MNSRYRATAKPGRPRGRLRPPKRKTSSRGGSQARAAERTAASAAAASVRAFIRASGVELTDDERAYTRRKVEAKLGKFASAIQRVSVRVRDVNGPRGGVDQACRIKVVLNGLPSVVVENSSASLNAAIDGAITGAEQAVRRTVRRRRMKPIRARV